MPTRYLLHPVPPAGDLGHRRQRTRMPVHAAAALVSAPELPASLTCAVHDISDSGARLEVDREARKPGAPIALPDEVTVYFFRKEAEALCRVTWRDGAHFGVEFLGPLHKPTPAQS